MNIIPIHPYFGTKVSGFGFFRYSGISACYSAVPFIVFVSKQFMWVRNPAVSRD